MGDVYIVGELEGHYKIGRSTDTESRLNSFSPRLPVKLVVAHVITSANEVWLERALHLAFRHRRGLGEWFKLSTEDMAMLKTVFHANNEGDLPVCIKELYEKRGGADLPGPQSGESQQPFKRPKTPLAINRKLPHVAATADAVGADERLDIFERADPVYGNNRYVFRYFGDHITGHPFFDGDYLVFRGQSNVEKNWYFIAKIDGVTHLCYCQHDEDQGSMSALAVRPGDESYPLDACDVLGVVEKVVFINMSSRNHEWLKSVELS